MSCNNDLHHKKCGILLPLWMEEWKNFSWKCPPFLQLHFSSLLPLGNPQIGVLKHREKYYAFSSKVAARSFASKPEEYIQGVTEKAKKCPELIQLLELHQQFACVTPYSQVGVPPCLSVYRSFMLKIDIYQLNAHTVDIPFIHGHTEYCSAMQVTYQ